MNGQACLKKKVLQAIGINKSIGNKDDIITKKVSELLNNNRALKARLFIDSLIEGARKEYGLYHQRKMDLIARLSTEWPTWGIGLDFFHNIIFPFTKNTIVQHFINLSERFDLGKTFYEIYVLPKNFNINNLEKYKVKIWYKKNNQSIEIKNLVDLTYLSFLEEWDEDLARNFRIGFEYNHSFLVKVIDADVGVQAIYTILEGILRNSAKHGRDNTNEMRVKIIFAENKAIVSKLLDDGDLKDNDCYYMLISCGKDVEDDNLVSKLNSYLSERIIDEGGKPTPGNWGMKEIKICSAFVSGENIETLNEESVDYIKIAKSSKIWKNEESRLVYVLKLQKPRYLLVWTDNFSQDVENYEKFGIKFVKDLDPPKMRWQDLDYDFLVVDDEKRDKYEKFNDKEKIMIPQRVIFLNKKEINKLNIDQIVQLHPLILKVYDKWLLKILNIKNIKLSTIEINFENQNQKNNKWKSLINSLFGTLNRKVNSSEIFLKQHDPPAENYKQAGLKTMEKFCLYSQYGTGKDLFFNFLSSLEPTEKGLAELVLRQFVESALLKILIIDERIAQSIKGKQVPEEKVKKNNGFIPFLIQKLRWMGILITRSVKIKGFQQVPELEFVKVDDEEEKKFYVDLELNKEGKILRIQNSDESFEIEDVDIIFVHQTKFNKILEQINVEKEAVIDGWKDRNRLPRWVIIHSGRGKPFGEKPENALFLEFSTLGKYLIYEPSKFYLVQIALGLKEGGEG